MEIQLLHSSSAEMILYITALDCGLLCGNELYGIQQNGSIPLGFVLLNSNTFYCYLKLKLSYEKGLIIDFN